MIKACVARLLQYNTIICDVRRYSTVPVLYAGTVLYNTCIPESSTKPAPSKKLVPSRRDSKKVAPTPGIPLRNHALVRVLFNLGTGGTEIRMQIPLRSIILLHAWPPRCAPAAVHHRAPTRYSSCDAARVRRGVLTVDWFRFLEHRCICRRRVAALAR